MSKKAWIAIAAILLIAAGVSWVWYTYAAENFQLQVCIKGEADWTCGISKARDVETEDNYAAQGCLTIHDPTDGQSYRFCNVPITVTPLYKVKDWRLPPDAPGNSTQ